MQDAESLFHDLTINVARLEDTFINTFRLEATAKPEEYDLPVRAYCVLSHAALEEYFEGIALYVMKQSIYDYIMYKKVRDSLLTLTAYNRLELNVDEDETADEIRTFDVIRPMLEDAKARFSRSVHKNQGISLKYLRRLLNPVAVDIKQDSNLKNSLMQLAKERGTFAHKGAARKVISPEDAKNYVNDCLELCRDIKDKTDQKFTS
jgi:methyltransferase-like protein